MDIGIGPSSTNVFGSHLLEKEFCTDFSFASKGFCMLNGDRDSLTFFQFSVCIPIHMCQNPRVG